MNLNLDTLHDEIVADIESRGLIIFHTDLRSVETHSAVYWNVDARPEYKQFLDVAVAAGAKIVTVFSRKFTGDQIVEALSQLQEAAVDRQERRTIEMRLREMSVYEGLTCAIELSFDHANRDYIFDLHADWIDDFDELVERIEESFVPEEEEDEGPLGGGYFSKN